MRGSTTVILKPDGSYKKDYYYDTFGNTTEGVGSFYNETQFTGATYDKSTGMHYMNARYYNPSTGRFLTQDSYTGNPYDPWTQNLYAYCGNNPVNFVDPTGHWFSLVLALFQLPQVKEAAKESFKVVAKAYIGIKKVIEENPYTKLEKAADTVRKSNQKEESKALDTAMSKKSTAYGQININNKAAQYELFKKSEMARAGIAQEQAGGSIYTDIVTMGGGNAGDLLSLLRLAIPEYDRGSKISDLVDIGQYHAFTFKDKCITLGMSEFTNTTVLLRIGTELTKKPHGFVFTKTVQYFDDAPWQTSWYNSYEFGGDY